MSDTVDLAELKDRLDGDKELFLEIAEVFFGDAPTHINIIKEAIVSKNAAHIKERAHTLKGALANLSVKKGSEIASSLEKAGKDSNLSVAPELLQKLEDEIEKFSQFVEEVKSSNIWDA